MHLFSVTTKGRGLFTLEGGITKGTVKRHGAVKERIFFFFFSFFFSRASHKHWVCLPLVGFKTAGRKTASPDDRKKEKR